MPDERHFFFFFFKGNCPDPNFVLDNLQTHLQNAVLNPFDEFDVSEHVPFIICC